MVCPHMVKCGHGDLERHWQGPGGHSAYGQSWRLRFSSSYASVCIVRIPVVSRGSMVVGGVVTRRDRSRGVTYRYLYLGVAEGSGANDDIDMQNLLVIVEDIVSGFVDWSPRSYVQLPPPPGH